MEHILEKVINQIQQRDSLSLWIDCLDYVNSIGD